MCLKDLYIPLLSTKPNQIHYITIEILTDWKLMRLLSYEMDDGRVSVNLEIEYTPHIKKTGP